MRTNKVAKHMVLRSKRGGVTLEYILVSTFATVVTIAALAYVGKVVKGHLGRMGERLGITVDEGSFDTFGEP